MGNRFLHLLRIYVWGCILIGCTERERVVTLDDSEILFNERLASITQDTNERNLFYIGTENGTIYVYNSESNHIDTLKSIFSRVYKVVRDPDSHSTLWVGVRNGGLRRCQIVGDSLVDKNQGYPLGRKGTQYSCYDIAIHPPFVYMATSQGLFAIEKEYDDLKQIYAKGDFRDKEKNLPPLSVSHLTTHADSLLFCTSDDGVLRINLAKNPLECEPTMLTKKCSKVLIIDGMTYAMSQGTLWQADINTTRILDSIPIKQRDVQTLYHVGHTFYVVGSGQLFVVADSMLHSTSQYQAVHLRSRARTDCYNVVVEDPNHNQSLLVTEKGLLRIGHSMTTFNKSGNVTNACLDGTFAYYLADGDKLFRQKKTGDEAEQVYKIPHGRKAQAMTVSGGTLYYADTQRKVWSAKVGRGFYWNVLQREHLVTDTITRRITAMSSYRGITLIGVQDGLVCLSDTCRRLVREMEEVFKESYITRFSNLNDTLLFISTLNDGVFMAKGDSYPQRVDLAPISFVCDVALEDTLYILTNHKLYRQENDSSMAIYANASGYSRVFCTESHHLVLIGEHGIRDIATSATYFPDIRFEPNACLLNGGRLYAGSNHGVVRLDGIASTGEPIVSWVQFVLKPTLFNRYNVLLLACLCLLCVLLLWWHDRRKMSIKALLVYKRSLLRRINELRMVSKHLDATISAQIESLLSETEQVDVGSKKKGLDELDDISMRIMELTGHVPLRLIQILRGQQESFKQYRNDTGYAEHAKRTTEAIDDHTLLVLNNQIEENSSWLKHMARLKRVLSDYETMSRGLPMIVGATDEMLRVLTSSQSAENKVAQVKSLLDQMDGATVRKSVQDYLENRKGACDNLSQKSGGYAECQLKLIREGYQSLADGIDGRSDFVDSMRKIATLDRNLETFNILIKVRQQLDDYNRANDAYTRKERVIERSRGNYVLDRTIEERDKEEKNKLGKKLENISKGIRDEIDHFYEIIDKGQESALFNAIGINRKQAEGQFLTASILVLLLTRSGLPVSRFKNMFLVNEQSLRRVKRNIEALLRNNIEQIRETAETNPTGIAGILLQVAENSLQQE